MKKNTVWDVFIVIYVNCWYIPLLAFLLGIKICLISLLSDSILSNQKVGRNNNHQSAIRTLDSSRISGHNYLLRKQTSSHSTTEANFISKELLHDWETLGDLTNAEIKPTATNRTDADSIWLVYNRIPRCAGETFVSLLEKLSEVNSFTHQEHEYHTPWPRFLLDKEQENLVTWFEYQHLPKSYDRHFFFVNFTEFQKFVKERPIYVNMVRDPVYRLRSYFLGKRLEPAIVKTEILRRDKLFPGSGMQWYHKDFEDCVINSDPECSFTNGTQDFTLAIPFFCGQQAPCVVLNSKWAVQKAKFVIEKHYSVVGVLEKLNETFEVLEHYVPKFFSGATQLYNKMRDKHLNRNWRNSLPVSATVRNIIEAKLPYEVELYQFINQRLDEQYNRIHRTRIW